ncbi:MAG TPA: SDR family NAD(P)-dependent oxidoreductase [Alphaproteobacteria bacterium]|nr:SDR family NAD(P)-dependent oxidoreductase [Alphaproteobacteria bacterium]
MTAQGRLAGRIAVITGASRGIGAAVARRFATEGAHVVLIARTVGGLEELDDAIKSAGGSATLVPLDLRDLDRIDPLGPALYERFGKLDILVGNAGLLGTLGPLSHHDAKLWNEVMAVNVTANWRLIRTLEPLLRRAEAGRAIFVTSGAAQKAQAFWGAYATSKAALDAMVRTWAAELASTKVRVNLLSPGPIRTAMRADAFPGEDPSTLRPPEAVTDAFVELALPTCTRNGEVVTPY